MFKRKESEVAIFLTGRIDLNKKFLGIFLFLILLQGCSSPFTKYYNDETGGVDPTKSNALILPTNEPKLYYGEDSTKDDLKMREDNYVQVGNSSFYNNSIDEAEAIDQAKRVHAEVVMLYSSNKRTVSGITPLTLPNTTNSSTNFNGNVYGARGSASYSGTANTTTYGTTTNYIPYSYDQSDFLATYWIKHKPRIFGANYNEPSSELKQQMGSNKGVLVTVVMKDSPAFDADILKGDIIKEIEGILVVNKDGFSEAIDRYQGKEVDLLIYRGYKEIHKRVKIRPSIN